MNRESCYFIYATEKESPGSSAVFKIKCTFVEMPLDKRTLAFLLKDNCPQLGNQHLLSCAIA